MKYIITSKPGMTPYSTEKTKKEAAKASIMAKRIGLDGEIFKVTKDSK
jgi:hypothetical protein